MKSFKYWLLNEQNWPTSLDGFWVFIVFENGKIQVFCPNKKLCGAGISEILANSINNKAVQYSPDIVASFIGRFDSKNWKISKINHSQRYWEKRRGTFDYWPEFMNQLTSRFGLHESPQLDERLMDAVAGGQQERVEDKDYYVFYFQTFEHINQRHGTSHRPLISKKSNKIKSYKNAKSRLAERGFIVFEKNGKFIFTDFISSWGWYNFHKRDNFEENQKELGEIILDKVHLLELKKLIGETGQDAIRQAIKTGIFKL